VRKPIIIAAVAGTAAVITIGAISLNGEDKPTVDPVAGAPRPAVDDTTPMLTRPPRMDSQTPEAMPVRPERPDEIRERPEDDRRGRDGRNRGRPGLGDRPMSADDWAERFGEMQKRRQDFMERFDADGDGELSEEERQAVRDYFRQRREEQMQRRLVERFDADGDGVLNEEEQLNADAEMEARRVERQARMTERFDTDGDGKLSEAENQAARESFRGGRGGRGGGDGANRWRDAVQRYDQDGDGELNLDESYAAYLDQFDQRSRREFVRRYDGNGDGGVDASDFNAFLEKYNAEDPSTDVNGDGRIDERDVEQFRDLMFVTTP
jgi:Ca2+-binding EF-hand superfamily protein